MSVLYIRNKSTGKFEAIKTIQGKDGEPGQRGTGYLKISTLPEVFNDGATQYRLPLDTVKNEANVEVVLHGDVLVYNRDTLYPVIFVNSDYVYCDVPTSIRGTDGSKYSLPTASSSTLGGVKIGSNLSISNGTLSVPSANSTENAGKKEGVTIVYPAANCTTFSSDSGTVTPLAVQKGAKMFAITRPTSSTNKAITRYSNTTGDVQDSKIIIEDVTNTRDTSKKAQVIAIPAEGGKKMVYGYCTDQVDGTSFIGGVFDASATSYPYNQGLAIGGTSGNLLWKGSRVTTTEDIPTKVSQLSNDKGYLTQHQSLAGLATEAYVDNKVADSAPVKGTDYWTAADREQMISDVIAALPNASEVSY